MVCLAKKPNILFLITDQQQKRTIEEDSPCLTPNIDDLRKDGIFFDKAVTTNAICSPSRASLMTGLLPHNHGMVDCTHNVDDYRARFREEKNTISRQLKEEGYKLGYFGKWHVERSNQLEKFGFDEYETEHDLPSFSRTMIESIEVRHKGYNDKILSGVFEESIEETEEYYLYNKGIDFIKRQVASESDEPWCLFVSSYAPHDPYVVPKELYDRYDIDNIELPESFYDEMKDKPAIYRRIKQLWGDLTPVDYKKAIACYYAYCTLVDTQVERIMATLKETKQDENTIIVYLSDHGDMMGAHGLFAKGVFPYEEVYKIPLIIKWPQGNLKGHSCDTFISMHDIAPTILEMSGCNPMEDVDGESIVPYLYNKKNGSDKIGFAEFHGQRMFYTQRIIWKENYKYVFNGFDYDEFYDLNQDPHEIDNQIDNENYKETIEEMARQMWSIIKDTGDFNLYDSEYYMFRFAPIGPEKELGNSVYNK